MEFNLFSVVFVLMFTIKNRFGRYLNSFACYLDFELLSPSEKVEHDFSKANKLNS